MHNCQSDHIVSFYGAFVADPNICICMEFMDKGSLDGIYKKSGPIPIEIVGKIAMAVLEGLTYLYEVHHIIHRGTTFLAPDLPSCAYPLNKTLNRPISFSTRKDKLRSVTLVFLES